jgi:hypothetical protein
MTTKTEQIIADSQHPLKGGTSAALISELRRLDALCAAYWREIEHMRSEQPLHTAYKADEPCPGCVWLSQRVDLRKATDAARREAGEGQC